MRHLPARKRGESARAMRGARADDDHLDWRRPAADVGGRDDSGLREFVHDFPAVAPARVQGVYATQPAQTGIDGDVS